MGLLERTRKSIIHARTRGPYLGWDWIFREKLLRRMGVFEVKFRVSDLSFPVYCRVVSSDIYEYTHLLGRLRVPFNLPIQPRYIVDAGSNVGYAALRFHADYPGATIVAVEPEEENVRQITKNCSKYPNIFIERAALWPYSTRVKIRTLDVGQNAFQVEEGEDAVIKALSINDIMCRHSFPHIDLLKIDIEGTEKFLFEHPDSKEWLGRVKMILVETHDHYDPRCTEVVEQATKTLFNFVGVYSEYRIYLAKNL